MKTKCLSQGGLLFAASRRQSRSFFPQKGAFWKKTIVSALRRGIMKPHEPSASRNNSRSGDPIGISIPQEVPT